MKRITELLQGIKHSNPLKESNEAKLLCSMPTTNIERSVNRGS